MKPPVHAVLLASARFYTPVIVLLAFLLLATRDAGQGVGFVAALVFAIALLIQMLVFGAAAARRAFPPWLARAALVFGAAATCLGLGLAWPHSAKLVEAGVFALTISAIALTSTALIGRAPTMRSDV